MSLESFTQVIPASERFLTETPWLTSRHSFSFGGHYDEANTSFGPLLVCNEDVVSAGEGFGTHPHRDLEIVTWVLSGGLVHQDSQGNSGVIYPGLAQRMSAGRGILHSERNDSWRLTGQPAHDEPVHFVQMWVLPAEAGIDPGYEQQDVNSELDAGGLVVVASGLRKHRHDRAIRISQRGAGMYAARLRVGRTLTMPDSPRLHLFVAAGALDLESVGRLGQGDAARMTASGGAKIRALADSEILVWELG
jgi:quercetin 2,3-dioxygenase